MKQLLLIALSLAHPLKPHHLITDFDHAQSDEKTDLLFADVNKKVNILGGLRHLKVASAEFASDCAVVVDIWKSLHGTTSLSSKSVSPIGCCDDQNSDIRGVRCSEDVGAVIALEWSSWGKWDGKLAGQIPAEIGLLKKLKIL